MQEINCYDDARARWHGHSLEDAKEERRSIVTDRRVTDLIVEIDRRIEQARRSNDEAYVSAQEELRNDAVLDQPQKLSEAA